MSKKGIGAGLFGLLVILLVLVLLGRQGPPPLRIGFVSGQTGKAADLGIDCRRGAEMAVQRVNAAGGVKGRQVQLVIRDDGHDTDKAKQVMQELLAMDLPVIIGHSTSSMTMATLPMVEQSKTLLVAPTVSTPLLTGIDDNFLRTNAISTTPASTMARYLVEVKKARKVGVIYDLGNQAYTEQWYQVFRTTFLRKGGVQVTPFTFTSAPDVHFLRLVNEMRRYDFDGLIIVANSMDGAMLSQQVRKIGWPVQLVLADWAATEQLISLGGVAVEGAVVSQYFNRQSTKPAYLAFKKEFAQLYKGEPGFGAMHAYNVTMIVVTSIAQQRPDESLKQTMLRISKFDGLQEDIVFDQYGDSNHPTYIGVVEDGAFKILEDFR